MRPPESEAASLKGTIIVFAGHGEMLVTRGYIIFVGNFTE